MNKLYKNLKIEEQGTTTQCVLVFCIPLCSTSLCIVSFVSLHLHTHSVSSSLSSHRLSPFDTPLIIYWDIKVLCVWLGRQKTKAKRFSRSLTFAFCMKFSQNALLWLANSDRVLFCSANSKAEYFMTATETVNITVTVTMTWPSFLTHLTVTMTVGGHQPWPWPWLCGSNYLWWVVYLCCIDHLDCNVRVPHSYTSHDVDMRMTA